MYVAFLIEINEQKLFEIDKKKFLIINRIRCFMFLAQLSQLLNHWTQISTRILLGKSA